MDGFTWVDGAVIGLIVVSGVLAHARGLLREALAIGGWVAGAVLGWMFAPQAAPLVQEIPVVSGLLDTCAAATLAGFAAVFAAALIVFAVFTPLIGSLVQNSLLNPVDQGLGFAFGVARGVLLVVLALVVHDFVTGAEGLAAVEDSRSVRLFADLQDRLSGEVAEQEQALSWLTGRFELLIDRSCGPGPAAGLGPAVGQGL